MADKARERKSHVKRIYKMVSNPDDPPKEGETEKKEINTDIFIDVLRIDKLLVKFKSKEHDQGILQIKYDFKWNDDKRNPVDNIDASKADKQYENANAKRKTKKLIIRDPDVKKADDDGDFYLWLLSKVKTLVRSKDTGSGATNQLLQFAFNNINPKAEGEEGQDKGRPSKHRKSTLLKVPNIDLVGLKMRDTDDSEGNPRSRIVDWDTYMEALEKGIEKKQNEAEQPDTQDEAEEGDEEGDDDIVLNVEFTDKFSVRFKVDEVLLGFENQLIQHVLQNKDIEKLFVPGDEDVKDADGKSAVLRLDPLQTIVNVGTNIIAVKFKSEDN